MHLLDALELLVPLIGAPAGRPGTLAYLTSASLERAQGKYSMARALVCASRHGGQAQAHGRQHIPLSRHSSDILSPNKFRLTGASKSPSHPNTMT